jgi:hypothetical protein
MQEGIIAYVAALHAVEPLLEAVKSRFQSSIPLLQDYKKSPYISI